MSWHRGKGGPDQPNISGPEQALLNRLHRGYREGDLLEKPFSDFPIYIGELHPTLTQTKPDYFFSHARVCSYLDGPHHKKGIRPQRDKTIRQLLVHMGYIVHEFDFERWGKRIQERAYGEIRDLVNNVIGHPEMYRKKIRGSWNESNKD